MLKEKYGALFLAYILAVNNNPLKDFPEKFCFVMKKKNSYKSICSSRGPRPSQLKFNGLFNQHFFMYFVRKNWRGGGELLNCY